MYLSFFLYSEEVTRASFVIWPIIRRLYNEMKFNTAEENSVNVVRRDINILLLKQDKYI